MSLTLIEAAKLIENPLQRGVVEIFPRTSPVLERLPFFNTSGMAYKYNREDTLPGVTFRSLNSTYTESTGVINPQVEELFVMGGVSDVDRVIANQDNVNDVRATHDAMKAKAVAKEFTQKFFKGDKATNPEEFDGLQVRLTGDQIINGGSNTSGGDAPGVALLDQLIDSVEGGPDALFMNKKTRRYVNSLRRDEAQATETVNDAFGRQIDAYAGVPIAVVDDDVLPFDETSNGGGNDSTSIYAVRFGAREYVSGIQGLNGLEVLDQGLTGTSYRTLIEWVCGVGVFHPKAAARLANITQYSN